LLFFAKIANSLHLSYIFNRQLILYMAVILRQIAQPSLKPFVQV